LVICSRSCLLLSSMGWSLSIHMDSSSCCMVTSNSISLFLPSIIRTCWQVCGFFFGGELVGYGLNWSQGVNGSIRSFIWCDWWISCGEMLVECIDQHSLINFSLVTTSWEGYLDCSLTIFLLLLSWINCGLWESIDTSFSNNGNHCHRQTSMIGPK